MNKIRWFYLDSQKDNDAIYIMLSCGAILAYLLAKKLFNKRRICVYYFRFEFPPIFLTKYWKLSANNNIIYKI